MKNWRIIGPLAALLLGFLLISGCTFTGSTSMSPAATPATQTVHVTVTPGSAPESKTVLLSDDLSQLENGWGSEYNGSKGKVFYSGGSLHIRDDNPPEELMYQPLNRKLNDFVLDVDAELVGGSIDNWMIVGVRSQDEYNWYSLAISSDGYYEIAKWENGNKVTLIKPTPSAYINKGVGAANHLHIEANKNVLSLSVNDHPLNTISDNTFSEGTIDLGANCMASGTFTEIAFKNLVITQL